VATEVLEFGVREEVFDEPLDSVGLAAAGEGVVSGLLRGGGDSFDEGVESGAEREQGRAQVVSDGRDEEPAVLVPPGGFAPARDECLGHVLKSACQVRDLPDGRGWDLGGGFAVLEPC
jgi:hypothetical protein